MCCELTRVVDEVATGGDANTMWVCFLWTKCEDNPRICDRLICGDEEDFSVSHHKYCIDTFLPRFIVLFAMLLKSFPKFAIFPSSRDCSSTFVFLWSEICWSEVLGRDVPYLVGNEINGLLTDYVVVL